MWLVAGLPPSCYCHSAMRPRAIHIRRLRILAGLVQTEAAARAGISVSQWRRIETGRGGGLKSLHAVADVLGVSFEDIVELDTVA